MTTKEMIDQMRSIAPLVLDVTGTYDLGCEFFAIVPEGVIYPEPGMLLDYSEGEWPPIRWKRKKIEERRKLLKNFLMEEGWDITEWENIEDGDIEDIYDQALNVDIDKYL